MESLFNSTKKYYGIFFNPDGTKKEDVLITNAYGDVMPETQLKLIYEWYSVITNEELFNPYTVELVKSFNEKNDKVALRYFKEPEEDEFSTKLRGRRLVTALNLRLRNIYGRADFLADIMNAELREDTLKKAYNGIGIIRKSKGIKQAYDYKNLLWRVPPKKSYEQFIETLDFEEMIEVFEYFSNHKLQEMEKLFKKYCGYFNYLNLKAIPSTKEKERIERLKKAMGYDENDKIPHNPH